MSNWRALEAEIVRIARQAGHRIDQNTARDALISVDLQCDECGYDNGNEYINLTEFAQELDRAGVRVK